MVEKDGTFWVDKETNELVLRDNKGEERFYIDEEMNFEGNKYLILVSSEDNDDDSALILKLIKNEDGDYLSIIEEDDEFERVKEHYLSI